MKIKSRVTGEVRELGDEGARTLIYAGIYDEVESPKKEPPPKKSDKSTKVEPLTTEDMPTVPTKKAP